MPDFKSNWLPKDKKGLLGRVRKNLRSETPLKPKLEMAKRSINLQINKLENILSKLTGKDSEIFRKTVRALKLRNKAKASVFANELVELRKLENKIIRSKLALEQIVLRIETVSQMGDIVSIMTPTTSVVRSIRSDLGGIMPEGNTAIDDIGNMLNDILLDARMVKEPKFNIQAPNSEAERILEEASALAEHRMSSQLPEIPAELAAKHMSKDILSA